MRSLKYSHDSITLAPDAHLLLRNSTTKYDDSARCLVPFPIYEPLNFFLYVIQMFVEQK